MKKITKKYLPNYKRLMVWEHKQARGNFKKGVVVGVALGTVGVLIVYFLLIWLIK